ncbi:tail fiber domain-containing protein [Salmonella enterica]|nr:tail fiber domain-containing protein [Salmonella enterica]
MIFFINHDNDAAKTSYVFDQNGNAHGGAWQATSDIRLKKNIERIADPLTKMQQLRGVTWDRIDDKPSGIGFIAQEVQAVFPDAVSVSHDSMEIPGGKVDNVLSLNAGNVAAALHHEAILALMEKVEQLEAELAELKG